MDNNATILRLAIDKLVPNKYQPRKFFDEPALTELATSIKNHGMINPILVRKKDDKYEIIAGERRFRAAKLIGLTEVPVIVKNADEQQMAELALIENLARQDLTAIETARAYEEIIKMGNHTQNDLAIRLGKSQATIANKLRLLSLPMEIQDAILNKQISERHARSLLSLKNQEKQIEILERIIDEKLTVKETEELVSLQNINEEDIKQAINDIMKSLNIKEEEKEDENMNNGNFFPNYDNNMGQNNNMSLNSLNNMNQMQPTMAPPIMPLEPENVMPTMTPPTGFNNPSAPMPNFGPAPIEPPVMPNNDELLFTQPPVMAEPAPVMDAPLFNPNINQMPVDVQPVNEFPTQNNFGINPEPMSFNQEPPMSGPIPSLFDQTFGPSVPVQEPVNNMSFNEQPSPIIEPQPVNPGSTLEPLFNQPVMDNPAPLVEPPMPNPLPETIQSSNRVEEVENLLNNNGIGYKLYSNDQGHCIIIEL